MPVHIIIIDYRQYIKGHALYLYIREARNTYADELKQKNLYNNE